MRARSSAVKMARSVRRSTSPDSSSRCQAAISSRGGPGGEAPLSANGAVSVWRINRLSAAGCGGAGDSFHGIIPERDPPPGAGSADRGGTQAPMRFPERPGTVSYRSRRAGAAGMLAKLSRKCWFGPPHNSAFDRRLQQPARGLPATRRTGPSWRCDMTLSINDTAPDFEPETTEGKIRFHDWIGNSWTVLFSHPKDFTPLCTTELGCMAKIKPEFEQRGVKIIGLSVDPLARHAGWAADIEETQGYAPNYPIIGDTDYNVAKLYGMLPASVSGDPTRRTPADNQTVRNVFVIGPDKKIKLILVYPMTTGRNFDEVMRVIDSLQLTARHKVATPVNWKQGEDVIIAGSVSDEDARKQYPDGWKAPKPYNRIVPQPKG